LRSALPLLLLRRVPLTRFVSTTEQALSVVALLAGLYFVLDALLVEWPASFNLRALPAALAGDVLLLALVALYARLNAQSRLTLPVFVAVESLWVWLTLIFIGAQLWLTLGGYGARATVLGNWAFVLYSYLTAILTTARWLPGAALRRTLAAALVHLIVFVCASYFSTHELWVADVVEEPAEPPVVTEEAVLSAQAQALQRELDALRPQRAGVDDLYAVGFAGEADENVFMHEVNAVRATLAQRFDANGRVVSLINNDRTVRDLPIANVTNLRAALLHIGKIIDRERDMVMVYVTTHGSEQHELSVSYEPLQLRQLDAAQLAQMLAEAGIKWRIIVLSACYAGGLIEPLKNEHTLILTAADAERPSFGCSPDSDMTYFGRAFVEHALQQTHSLTEAFEHARKEIAKRESAEGQEHSNPQMFVGSLMVAKLRTWQQGLDPAR
jgi:hypothetical protein